jgi:hypothetical protein
MMRRMQRRIMHAPQIAKDRSGTVAQGAADPGRVLPRAAAWLVWAVSGVGVTLGVLALVYGALNYDSVDAVLTRVALQAVWAMSFPVVGAVIATHRPGNPLGWIFLVIGVSTGLVVFGYEYASYGFRTAPGTAPGGGLAVWINQWAWAPGLGLLLTFVPLLFPDGRLPSRRWRPVAWLSTIPIVVIPVLTAVALWSWRGPALLDPSGVSQGTSGLGVILLPAYVLMLGCGLACLAALLLRFRRARGIERQQLKWLLFACAVTITILLVVQPNTSNEWKLGMLLALPLFPSVPIAAGVAILRYRLYEIDRIINRTLVYGLLTAVLGLCYAAGSLLFVLVARTGSDPPSWLVAAATLAAAALFRPARRRIQAAVDRRFNRRRYNAAKTIEAFSARLRDEVDLDTLSAELLAVVDQTMQPAHVSCWLRPSPSSSSGTARSEARPAPWAY